MRFIVCGGRDFDDWEAVTAALLPIPLSAVLVHGDARGADTQAAQRWASFGGKEEAHPAKWSLFGRSAGIKRNQEMLDAGADFVLAFPGGAGTADMVRRAKAAGIEVREAKCPA
jgi:hypothetical protein